MNNFPKSYRRILFSFSNITDNVFQDTEVTHLLVDFFCSKNPSPSLPPKHKFSSLFTYGRDFYFFGVFLHIWNVFED